MKHLIPLLCLLTPLLPAQQPKPRQEPPAARATAEQRLEELQQQLQTLRQELRRLNAKIDQQQNGRPKAGEDRPLHLKKKAKGAKRGGKGHSGARGQGGPRPMFLMGRGRFAPMQGMRGMQGPRGGQGRGQKGAPIVEQLRMLRDRLQQGMQQHMGGGPGMRSGQQGMGPQGRGPQGEGPQAGQAGPGGKGLQMLRDRLRERMQQRGQGMGGGRRGPQGQGPRGPRPQQADNQDDGQDV